MNITTENVTLYAVFIKDILSLYEDKKDQFARPLFEMVKGYDLSDPFHKVPMDLYNSMCNWLEQELGPANLRKVGVQIGETVYDALLKSGSLPVQPKPVDVLRGLVDAAANMIQDPEKRGWEIREAKEKSIVMRRTQNFNSILQLGLLRGLVQKSGVRMVEVKYLNSVAEGAEYDDYLITWM